MALSEYQGAIALLDLDRGGTAQAQQQQQQQQQQQLQHPLPRIVMPDNEVEHSDSDVDQRLNMPLRSRNRTSIADLLSDSSERADQQQQLHLQSGSMYANNANPPIDTQLLSPLPSASPSSTSGVLPSSTNIVSAAQASAAASAAAAYAAASSSGTYPYVTASPLSLPSLPSVMQRDNSYRHHSSTPTDPALTGVGVVPANPVRSAANANADYHSASAPTQAQSSASKREHAGNSSSHGSIGVAPSFKNEAVVQAAATAAAVAAASASSGQTPSASRPYKCPHAGCKWTFARHSDQRRHLRSHYSPNFHCPYWRTDPTCHRNGGAFNRLDVLKRHLRLVHFVQLKDTDAGWCRLCQKMFASPRVFVEHCEKCADSVQPTEWKKVEGDALPPQQS
ncbi:uncharacterized protein V1518DRAFT_416233 [Limtongia smithiae]|uniref:uncharacterized protein n=1 Tax=Limtongia smithiae TaxID=1125753 RepID=UPI0034CE2E87